MRRKGLSKIAAVSLAFSLCVGTLAGCGKKEDEKSGSDDLYTVMQEAQELKTGEFEMTIGLEAPADDEKMELILSGVTTDESFDIEVALDIDIDGMTAKGAVTSLVYDEQHLYVNLAEAMDFMNSMEEIGELSDFGIDEDYLDIYVGDLYEQTENTAAGEMAEIMLEILEDAATSTDKKEGAAEDGSFEFKDAEVIAFIGNFAQGMKDNAEDIVDITVEASNVSYDYDDIFDYYGDTLSEYGIDMDALKAELEATEDMEITDEQKETMVEEIETACDELITAAEDDEDADAKGSKFLMEASLDGKKGSRTYEMNIDFLAASESEGDEARIYMNYVFEEGEGKVEVPEESIELDALLEILAPLLGSTGTIDSGITDPEIDWDEPTETSNLVVNEDGSYALGCTWSDCEYTGRVDFTTPEGYVVDGNYSDSSMLMIDDADDNLLCVTIYEGNDYLDSYDYTNVKGINPDAPTGSISTPIGTMEYIIDNTESYFNIYGFIVVDAGHYLEIDYTMYSYSEPTDEKIINELNIIAQGLKAAQ